MIKIERLIVGELSTNCYLVYEDKVSQAIIIDPGDEANFISEKILRLRLKPKAIIATHGHFDHILAARELQLAFEIPFLLHQKDEKIVAYMKESSYWWLKKEIVESPPQINRYLDPKRTINLGSRKLKIIPTPGHTPGSVCFYLEKEGLLFSGDTLFKDGPGRTDLPYSSSQELLSSLKKLSSLPPQTTILPGHGPTTSLKQALRTALF